MTKVTSKNTKGEILEAYNAAQEEIERLKKNKSVTAEIVKENNDIKDKHTALLKTVGLLEKEIEELNGIKKEVDTLENTINAGKNKIKELNEEYNKIKADLKAEYQEEKNRLEKERLAREEYEESIASSSLDEIIAIRELIKNKDSILKSLVLNNNNNIPKINLRSKRNETKSFRVDTGLYEIFKNKARKNNDKITDLMNGFMEEYIAK